MKRLVVVLALVSALGGTGCASRQAWPGPAEPKQLEAEIAEHGQVGGPVEPTGPDSPRSDALVDGLTTAVKVARLCLLLPALFVMAWASRGGGNLHPDSELLWPTSW
jgi:hypothetical protein